MQTIQLADLTLSRFMLGTCQFGYDYGLANTCGQHSYEKARDLIASAYEGGVNCLDTAPTYGNSEEVLGKVLQELKLSEKMTVVSKVQMLPKDLPEEKAEEWIENSVTKSLKLLQLDYLPICIFHYEMDFRHIDILLKLRDRGLVHHVGGSLYDVKIGKEMLNSGLAEAVQPQTHMLDQSFIRGGFFSEAKAKGVATFIRSVYFQGLLLMPEEKVPEYLAPVIPVRRQLQALAAQAGISMVEFALRYVLSIDGVSCLLLGIDNEEQLQQNIPLFDKGNLDVDLMKAVDAVVPELPDDILRPYNWPWNRVGKSRPE